LLWVIQKNTEAEEKWVLRKEELEKEIRENRSLREKNIPN
jgi:hypothetical protein